MTFGDYVRMLRTYWKSMLVVTLVGVLVAVGVTALLTPKYTAKAGVLFTAVASDSDGQSLAFAQQYTQSRMVVYRDLVDTPQVLGVVVSNLDLEVTPTKLADRVSADFDAASTLLTISVKDTSATRATRIAGAVAQSLAAAVSTFEKQPTSAGGEDGNPQIAASVARVNGQLVSDPTKPTSPSFPSWKLNLVAGLVLGLVLAAAQAAIRYVRAGYVSFADGPVAPVVPAAPPAPAADPKPKRTRKRRR